MVSLIKMICLMMLLISISVFTSFNHNEKEYNIKNENISFIENIYFDNKSILDSIIEGEIISDLIKSDELKKVEDELNKVESIKKVDIYYKDNFELRVNITNRIPVAYLNENNAYLDIYGEIISGSSLIRDSLPAINGIISKSRIAKVINVISELNKNILFNNQLDSIWFEEEQLFMKLKNLGLKIKLGNEYKLKNKFKMLEAFYMYQLSDYVISDYKQIDLVYNDRLIAIKK